MKKHSIIGGSKAGRYVHCPASAKLEHRLNSTDDSKSIAANMGDLAHEYCAAILTNNVPPNVTPEMAAYCQDYINLVPEYAVIETPISASIIHPDAFGTPDAWWYMPDAKELHLVDLKYGWVIVEAKQNWSLIFYTAAVLHQLGETIGLQPHEVNCVLTIVQPRPYHKDGSKRSWRISGSEIMAHVDMLRAAAHEAMGDDPTYRTGEHCRYCKGVTHCNALQNSTYCIFDWVETLQHSAGGNPQVELTMLRGAFNTIKNRLLSLETEAIALINSGQTVPGWRVENSPGKRVWISSKEDILKTLEILFQKSLFLNKPVTPLQAINAGIPEEIINQYSKREPGKSTLIPETSTNAFDAFGSK